MKKQIISGLIVCGLAACSPQNNQTAHNTNAAASSVVAASQTHIQATSQIQAASQTAWMPPPKADSPKAEAQQIYDLMAQFQLEAGQRMNAQRQKNMQPSQAESLVLVRQEAAAIRHDAKRLQQLDLSDKNAVEVQAALSKNMLAFADSADLQVKATELLAQGKQAEADAMNQQLGEMIQQIQHDQEKAHSAYSALLKKHKIPQ